MGSFLLIDSTEQIFTISSTVGYRVIPAYSKVFVSIPKGFGTLNGGLVTSLWQRGPSLSPFHHRTVHVVTKGRLVTSPCIAARVGLYHSQLSRESTYSLWGF